MQFFCCHTKTNLYSFRLKLKDEANKRHRSRKMAFFLSSFSKENKSDTKKKHGKTETKSTWQKCASASHVTKNTTIFCVFLFSLAHFIKRVSKDIVQEGKISWNWWKTKQTNQHNNNTIFLWFVYCSPFVLFRWVNFVKNMANKITSHVIIIKTRAPHRIMTKRNGILNTY